MIFFIDPNRSFLERSNIILPKNLELYGTRSDPTRPRGHNNISCSLLGRRQRDYLALATPLGDEQTVGAVHKNAEQVLLRGAQVLAADGDLGAGKTLAG